MQTPEGRAKNKGGRPEGSMNRLAKEARETALRTGNGKLPHEILLDMARGHPQELLRIDPLTKKLAVDPETGEHLRELVVPDLEQMKDAAKAAAPYFAPKISTVEVIQGISDHELDEIIARAAAEAGVSLSPTGEGEEREEEDREVRPRRRSVE